MRNTFLASLLAMAMLTLPLSASAQQQVSLVGANAVPYGPTNPLPTGGGGVAQASIINVTSAIAATDTTVSLGGSFTHLIVKTDTGASNIYIDLANGAATTADFKLDPGGALTYVGAAVTGFHYLGDSAVGNISYLAW